MIAAFYGGWVASWLAQAPYYPALLNFMGVKPVITSPPTYAHPPVPFFDIEGVISWSECARKGIDPYRHNLCDPYHRPANYSPLLVDMPLEKIGVRNTLATGLALDLAFLVVLPWILQPRNRSELAIAAAACCSSATFYAVERANIDVLVFTAVAVAALATQRTLHGRIWLYAAAIGGGLIKFYPLAIGGMALRERPRVLCAIAAAAATAMACLAWWHGPEMRIVLHQIPAFHYLSDMFGAGALPLTLQRMFGWPDWVVRPVKLILLSGLTVSAVRLSAQLANNLPQHTWLTREMTLLLCGSMIMVGCFLLQTNNSYRAIFLMLVIPGLVRLARRLPEVRGLFRSALAALLVLMWSEVIRGSAGHWSPLVWSLFVLREVLWWFLIFVLTGLVICFLRQAPALRECMLLMAHRGLPNRIISPRADN